MVDAPATRPRTAATILRASRLDVREQIEIAVPDASRVFRRAYENYFARLGINLTQALIIGHLDVVSSHTLNQTDLARRLGLRKAAIGAAIEGLVARGHIRRVNDPEDGRAKLLSLSEQGSSLAADVDQGFGELAAALRRDVSSEQRKTLVATLATMRRNLEEFEHSGFGAGESSPPRRTTDDGARAPR